MNTIREDLDGNSSLVASHIVERASARLAAARNCILIFDQDPNTPTHLNVSLSALATLRSEVAEAGLDDLLEPIDSCCREIQAVIIGSAAKHSVAPALDALARVEEALLSLPLRSNEFLDDISELVDSSFGALGVEIPSEPTSSESTDFEIDEETLEIFRSEAAELLNKIDINITKLQVDPGDREALWEVRRNAHTFKGAAGIVGLAGASMLAHRVEDLLDKIVEIGASPDPKIVALLASAAGRLEEVSLRDEFADEPSPADDLYPQFSDAISSLSKHLPSAASSSPGAVQHPDRNETPHQPAERPKNAPMVRVSLDRLDDLISLTRHLAESRSLLEDQLAVLDSAGSATEALRGMRPLFDAQDRLTEEIRRKLASIRMVRFGALETRLARAVHVTCEEENKNAVVTVVNGDCEVDTQVVDALVEPMLHLLKNAVVHGIEDAETRRLIGKPDKGSITVEVRANDKNVTVSISDDGGGISADRLKQKAVDQCVITRDAAGRMAISEAFGLIFERGLTTAERLNLNAGRGIGMSIVKQSVETHGGQIRLESEPQIGTTFTIQMPTTIKRDESTSSAPNALASPKPEAKKALVLIVDDSASVRGLTTRLVESAGHRAITAVNGAEAIELLLSDALRPDLILSDVEMPVMDGWELLECIRSSDELSTIPVVMVTSLAAIEYVKKAFLLGAADYKVKPISASEVSSVIAGTLAKTTPTEPAACSA